MKNYTLLLFFFCIIKLVSSATYCGDNPVPGAIKVNCFGSNACWTVACVNATCVSTWNCAQGQTCSTTFPKTCITLKRSNENENVKPIGRSRESTKKQTTIDKNDDKSEVESRFPTTNLPNLIVNGGFENGTYGWMIQGMGDGSFNITTTGNPAPHSGSGAAVFENSFIAFGSLSQEFPIPVFTLSRPDCVTHFDLSFYLQWANDPTQEAWGWVLRSNMDTEKAQMFGQEFYIDITDYSGTQYLKKVFEPTHDTPLASSGYQKINFSFDIPRAIVPSGLLRLTFTSITSQNYFTMVVDDIVLRARCLERTVKTVEEEQQQQE